MGDARLRLVLAAACALLLALPFLFVTIPPITDLPQLAAQVRLLLEHDSGTDVYRVAWSHPNRLGYLPILAAWAVGGPLAAGRLGLLFIGLCWVGAIHWTAAELERPAAGAVLCTLFFFHKITYWGFLNFLTGTPVFLIWLVLVLRLPAVPGWRRGLALTGLSLLLYWAHVLWLAAGLIWLGACTLAVEPRRALVRRALVRLAWTSPALLLTALWYPSLAAGGFTSPTTYGHSPLERLRPSWLVDTILGGMRGRLETAILLAAAVWLLLALGQHRLDLRDRVHRPLLAASLLFLAAGLTLPGIRQSTIFFAARWMAPATVLLVLALPAPRLRPLLQVTVPLLLVASLTLATANTWWEFEEEELAGLGAALQALPDRPRLLGLDFRRQSPRVRDFPYYHLYAYGQVLRGGSLNNSFAELASSLVVFAGLPKTHPWTEHLDWDPKKLRRSDLDHFDHLLVHGDDAMLAYFEQDPRLEPVTGGRPWRLWRIRRGG